MLADQLDFRYVDDEIVVTAADAANAYPEAVSQAEARHPGRWLEIDFNRLELTESVRELIRQAIVTTADEGNAVIVAHAASFALTDRESVFRVRVTASTETRVRRLGEIDGLDDKEAAKRVKDSDKNLKAYLKHFYGVGNEHPTHYDLVVNTDRLSPPARRSGDPSAPQPTSAELRRGAVRSGGNRGRGGARGRGRVRGVHRSRPEGMSSSAFAVVEDDPDARSFHEVVRDLLGRGGRRGEHADDDVLVVDEDP